MFLHSIAVCLVLVYLFVDGFIVVGILEVGDQVGLGSLTLELPLLSDGHRDTIVT